MYMFKGTGPQVIRPVCKAIRLGNLDKVKEEANKIDSRRLNDLCQYTEGGFLGTSIGKGPLLGKKTKQSMFFGPQTPLMIAAVEGHLSIVKYLVEEKGVDVNVAGARFRDYTALQMAQLAGQKEVCEYLQSICKSREIASDLINKKHLATYILFNMLMKVAEESPQALAYIAKMASATDLKAIFQLAKDALEKGLECAKLVKDVTDESSAYTKHISAP